MPVWEDCWAKANDSLAFFGTTCLIYYRQQAFNRADALDGPERFFLAGQRVRLTGCKVSMASVLVRKVLQPAQSDKDREQSRGTTPCSKAQRTTIFCSVVCNTAGVCRKARLWGFGDCCHTGCFVCLLFAWDNFGYFLLPDTRARSGQPATKPAWSLEGRAAGKRLCWHGLGVLGRAQRSALWLCWCTCSAALDQKHGVGATAMATQTGPTRGRGYVEKIRHIEGFASVPLLDCFF